MLPVPDGTVVTDETGTPIADLVGAGTELVVAEGGRGGLGNAALASAKRKAPGFALLGEPGEERTIHLELKVVADVGPGRLPQRGQVQPDRGAEPGTAEDRGLPVHDTGAQPRRGQRGRRHLHRCRRPRTDRRGQRGTRPRPRLPAPHRALRGPGPRRRPRHDGAGPKPGRGHRGDRARAGPLRRPRGPPPAGRAEQGRRPRRPRDGRPRRRGGREPGLAGDQGQRGHPRGPEGALLRDGPGGRAGPARAGRHPVGADRDPAAVATLERGVPRPAHRRGLAGPRGEARALDPADRLQQRRGGGLPRRPAEPARRGGAVARARCRGGRSGADRRPRRRGRLRLPPGSGRRGRRCSGGAARTSGSPSSVPPLSDGARSRRRWPSAASTRPAPTWPVGWAVRSPRSPTGPTGSRDEPDGGLRCRPGRGQGRLVVADHRRRWHRSRTGARPGRHPRRRTRERAPRSCWSPRARSPPDWPRWR